MDKSKRKVVVSAIVGNIVEYYDFGIYAVFTPIIGQLFFPSSDPFIQMILAFSVFAIGFLMRPLGGFIFGHIGDKLGRKVSLTISIIGMALSTFGIGILPSYETIGILAPIILIIIRLFQGICIGGEGAGSAIFILEHLTHYKAGLVGSIVMSSNVLGTLLATVVGIGINYLFGLDEVTWRYGFILGGFMGFIGLYMRKKVHETPVFIELKKQKEVLRMPAVLVIEKKWRRIIVTSFLAGTATALAYTIRGYLNVFFLSTMKYTNHESLYFTSFALVIFVVTLPLAGFIADKFSYQKFVQTACIFIILLIIPAFSMIANDGHNVFLVLYGLMIIGMLAAFISAPIYGYAIRSFPVNLRYSGVALSWNIGNAIFGGTAPAIAMFLTAQFGSIGPAYYLLGMPILFLMVNYIIHKLK